MALFQDWSTAPGCMITDPADPAFQVPSLGCLPVVFSNVINALLLFVGSVAAILIVYAAIEFARSGGDQKQVQSAKQIMTYAIIGLILVLCSFGIIIFIAYITNQDCIKELGLDACL